MGAARPMTMVEPQRVTLLRARIIRETERTPI
jgi:hypothetical protein